jgi:VanZ family protein
LSELQPWRNQRPAPHLPEYRPQLAAPRSLVWLRNWWPALLWAGVIFSLSTDSFSSDHTASVFSPIFHWLIPSLSDAAFAQIHHVIRKSAHFTEYFVFCLLLFRGIRGTRTGWRWTWSLAALGLAAGYSALDEIHQAFVASRTASPYDSLLDSVGAFVAFLLLYLWFHVRRTSHEIQTE